MRTISSRMSGMSNSPQQSGADDLKMDNYVFRAIADYTYDWEAWHAPDGRLLWVNAAVERMTGYCPEECLKMPDYPYAVVAAGDRESISRVLQDAQNGGSGNDVEFQLVHRNGSVRWAAVSWQPMYDERQKPLGFRASVRDITERHQLRDQLRLHNQQLEQVVQERTARIAQLEEHRLKMEKLAALGQMAAGVAHEVNNPLAGIRNAFALFKANLPVDDENYELLELIDSEIERISTITHQMYQLYRPSQQSPARCDLIQVVDSVVVLVKPTAERSRVRVTPVSGQTISHEELGPTDVILRENECRQILLNVVRNAIQASPSGGEVLIEISTSASEVMISVRDQGRGIPADAAARIFDPFFSTKVGSRQGMGLGLSVSRSLAEAMGGAISVDKKYQNGACFRITLPRRIVSDE